MNAPAPRYDDELVEMLNYYAGNFRVAITELLRDRKPMCGSSNVIL